MPEIRLVPDIAEQHVDAVVVVASVPNSSANLLRKAGAEFLTSKESPVTAWLRRYQEAGTNTRRLVASLCYGSHTPAKVLQAQQEWMASAFDLVAADASACHGATLQIVGRARS
jgi:hypothetical protein